MSINREPSCYIHLADHQAWLLRLTTVPGARAKVVAAFNKVVFHLNPYTSF